MLQIWRSSSGHLAPQIPNNDCTKAIFMLVKSARSFGFNLPSTKIAWLINKSVGLHYNALSAFDGDFDFLAGISNRVRRHGALNLAAGR